MQKATITAPIAPISIANGAAMPVYTMIRPSPNTTLAPGAMVVTDWKRTRPSPIDRSRLGPVSTDCSCIMPPPRPRALVHGSWIQN